MRILHIVPGLDKTCNGIAVAAKLIADGQRADGHEVRLVEARQFEGANLFFAEKLPCDEAWVHSMWTPPVWKACWKVLKLRSAIGTPRLVRMTHANLDPMRLRYHGWKKRLVMPMERWLFARTDRVVTTGPWESEWCRKWGVKGEIQEVDLGKLGVGVRCRCRAERKISNKADGPHRVLYLGRRHPLKGVEFLERAVREINEGCGEPKVELRVESDLTGAEKEAAWEWCDVLCLPTLSENFGLVVAEALERGKRVITTDGAPAWAKLAEGEAPRLIYLRGFREGSERIRVELLKEALRGRLEV